MIGYGVAKSKSEDDSIALGYTAPCKSRRANVLSILLEKIVTALIAITDSGSFHLSYPDFGRNQILRVEPKLSQPFVSEI